MEYFLKFSISVLKLSLNGQLSDKTKLTDLDGSKFSKFQLLLFILVYKPLFVPFLQHYHES